MNRGEICNLAERLAEKWGNGNACDVIDKIMSLPAPIAAVVAAQVSRQLDELFDAGPRFRSVLLDRAEAHKPAPDSADQAKEACRLLVVAYNRGTERGDSVDWDDVDAAYSAAVKAVGDGANDDAA